jgi:hypothetical protein
MQELSRIRTRWAAIGAAVAVSLGAGGVGISHATIGSGERAVFVPITPCRLADTRPGTDNVGGRSAPLAAADTFTLTATGTHGNCTLPATATAVSLNVTAVNQTAETFLTVYPTGSAKPLTSNLNPKPGQPPTPNAVTVDVNASGQFDIFNFTGTVDVIVDVVGYYEDHNHDDRYYTKSQTDALIAGVTVGRDNLDTSFILNSKTFSSQSLAPGVCILQGKGDLKSGTFAAGKLVMPVFESGTVPDNVMLLPGMTKTLSNGFGVATYQLCNTGNNPEILDGTIVVRIIVLN